MANQIMKINQLVNRIGAVVEATVSEVSEARSVKDGQQKVQTIVLQDETGSIDCTLWDADCNTLTVGEKIKIDGFVKEFKDKLTISKGKYGKIEHLGSVMEGN